MQKNRKIFQTNSHKSYENLQRICIRHHIALINISSVILKEKLWSIEISARKLHLCVVIVGLKVKFFENESIRFHYSFEYFNDYLPFKCLMVV